jgi:4-amino-4-deoxy-L-arabinose transferase-like glycosyltransferase
LFCKNVAFPSRPSARLRDAYLMESNVLPGAPAPRLPLATHRYIHPVAFLVLVLAIAWFGGLGQRGLFNPDEGRYAEIPREMLASGDWLTPRLNGLKYFEKPPLQYWATAVAFSVLGESEWTARLWPALTGFAGVVLLALACIQLWSFRVGVLAGMLLSTSAGYFLAGQFLTLDMGLTFFMTGALLAFLLAQREGHSARRRSRWMLVSWAAIGLAFLSKGLVALVLPGLTLFAYALSTRSVAVLTRLNLVVGGTLALFIAAPWFILVQQQNPEFFQFFFVHEHFQRFSTDIHHRAGPWWYFIPIVLLGMMPWTSPALASLGGFRSLFRRPSDDAFDSERFLLIWVLVVFAFFSISKSKLPGYILPAFPALSILAAIQLARSPRSHLMHSARGLTIIGAVWMVALPSLGSLRSVAPILENASSARLWFYLAGITMITSGWFSYRLQSRGQLWPAANLLAATMLVVCILCSVSLSGVEGHYSARHLVEELGSERRASDPSIPFYSVKTFDDTLPFYLRRTITLVDYKGELGEGIAADPQRYVVSVDRFATSWADHSAAFAVMTPRQFDEFVSFGLPMRELARDQRQVLVVRE